MGSGGRHTEQVDGGRSAAAVDARTLTGLRAIVRRARGWTCDIREVALDDQAGKLHVPLLARVDRRSPSVRVAAGELIVRRVEEFAIEVPRRTRWFELLMVHQADHGSLPPDNAKNPPPNLGRLSPA